MKGEGTSMSSPLRVGLVGASKIAIRSVLAPARVLPGIEVVAVSARDPGRAEAYAAEHGIGRVYASYAEMLRDSAIDLAYVGTTPNVHAEQALGAVEAGKPVLVEKPFAMNADEAQRVFEAAHAAGVPVFEGMHSLHHRLWARVMEVIEGGMIGAVRHVEAEFSAFIAKEGNFRWDAQSGGGVLRDLGGYPLAWVRRVCGDAFRVTQAELEFEEGVGARFSTELMFKSGVSAAVRGSMIATPARVRLIVEGERGRLDVTNPLAPQLGHLLQLNVDGKERTETLEGPSTFEAQLTAVRATLQEGKPFPLPADSYVRSMEAIDRVRAVLAERYGAPGALA
jgi:predicted dehydrogenase